MTTEIGSPTPAPATCRPALTAAETADAGRYWPALANANPSMRGD